MRPRCVVGVCHSRRPLSDCYLPSIAGRMSASSHRSPPSPSHECPSDDVADAARVRRGKNAFPGKNTPLEMAQSPIERGRERRGKTTRRKNQPKRDDATPPPLPRSVDAPPRLPIARRFFATFILDRFCRLPGGGARGSSGGRLSPATNKKAPTRT